MLRAVEADDPIFSPWKPGGFWWEVDGAWRARLRREGTSSQVFMHAVELGESNVLRLVNGADIRAFDARYRIPGGIDWARVAEHYDGVEIAPYRLPRLAPTWLWTWDCASGVLWQPRRAQVTYLSPLSLG